MKEVFFKRWNSLNKMFRIQIIQLLKQTHEGCCWRKLCKTMKRLRNYLIIWIEKEKGNFVRVLLVNCSVLHRSLLTLVSKKINNSNEKYDYCHQQCLQEFILAEALGIYLHDIFLIDFLVTECFFDNVDECMIAIEDDTIPVILGPNLHGNVQETKFYERKFQEQISMNDLNCRYTTRPVGHQPVNKSDCDDFKTACEMKTTISPLLFLLPCPPLVISEFAHPSSLHDFEDKGIKPSESFLTEKHIPLLCDIQIKNTDAQKFIEQSQVIKYLTTMRDPIFYGSSVTQVFDAPSFMYNEDLVSNINADQMDNDAFVLEVSPESEGENDEMMEEVMSQILVVCDTYFSELGSVELEFSNEDLEDVQQQHVEPDGIMGPLIEIITALNNGETVDSDTEFKDDEDEDDDELRITEEEMNQHILSSDEEDSIAKMPARLRGENVSEDSDADNEDEEDDEMMTEDELDRNILSTDDEDSIGKVNKD